MRHLFLSFIFATVVALAATLAVVSEIVGTLGLVFGSLLSCMDVEPTVSRL
jgi:sterol desaturase/sphingolipid hydroxylase (fatty acid hydroxylase superfamily)